MLQLVNHIQARAMQNELSHCIHIALPANSQRKHIALILCFIHSEYSNIRLCVNIHNLLAIQQRFHNLIASLTTGNMKRISASLFITIWEENDVVLVIWIRIVLQEILHDIAIVLVRRVTQRIASLLQSHFKSENTPCSSASRLPCCLSESSRYRRNPSNTLPTKQIFHPMNKTTLGIMLLVFAHQYCILLLCTSSHPPRHGLRCK